MHNSCVYFWQCVHHSTEETEHLFPIESSFPLKYVSSQRQPLSDFCGKNYKKSVILLFFKSSKLSCHFHRF